ERESGRARPAGRSGDRRLGSSAAGGGGPPRGVPHPRRGRHRAQRSQLPGRRGRDPGRPRRVGFRQVGHRQHRDGHPADAARPDHPGSDPLPRRGAARRHRRAAPRAPRREHRHDLPGRAVGAEPGVHRRVPDRRAAAHPARDEQARRPHEGRGAAGHGRHPGRPPTGEQLPARVLRRHATARDDRDVAGARPGRADRRRTDDGPGRDGAGPDHGPARRHPDRAEHGADPHHPRPRRRRRGGRPHRGDVRGPDRGAGRRARAVRQPLPPVHAVAAGVDPPAGQQGDRAEGHQGPAAVADPHPVRLPVPPPLPHGHRPVPHRGAAAGGAARWAQVGLPVRRGPGESM
ncbi:MAG: Oligopeptide transport ATP-binding protein OppD, partial [uncultured Pseudonocardia sp.]